MKVEKKSELIGRGGLLSSPCGRGPDPHYLKTHPDPTFYLLRIRISLPLKVLRMCDR
jgi:hypothetical protein